MGIGLVVIYCLISATILQAEEVEELRGCAAIDEDANRLACYDRTMTRLPLSDNASTQRSAADAAVPSSEQIAPVAEPATKSTATVELHMAGEPEETFSRSENTPEPQDIATPGDEPEPSSERDQFTAIVTEITRRPHGEHVVVLDNGQVWTEEFGSSYFPVEVGDPVTIKNRWLGGYRLVTASGRGYSIARVR